MLARSEPNAHREASTTTGQTEPLTEVERSILDFMVRYLRANTYQPSIREIGEQFGIKSTKTVSEHLQSLADKGCLERDPSRSRGVRILSVDLTADTVVVPCFSRMPAEGSADGAEAVVSIDRHFGSETGSFMVRAGPGDLAVLGVHEGDMVLVTPTLLSAVENGTVVVAEVESRRTFHRFSREGGEVSLEALQPGGGTTLIQDASADTLRLLGRVTGFYRRMDEIAATSLTQH